MFTRENCKKVKVNNIVIGGNNHIVIQSMCNIKTSKTYEVIKQIKELESYGCEMIRVSILDENDANSIKTIKENINIPIVADIHFDYKLALLCIENGVDKIRINPGNIGSHENTKKVVLACKDKGIPIRIGINSGSLEKTLYDKYGGVTPEALFESISNHIKLLESLDFYDIVLSIKATDIKTTIETNRLLSKHYNYPIHIGLTESGTITSGTIRSSYTLGVLLNNHIGNTIRVSLTGNPVNEIPVAKEILNMFGLYKKPTLISCPTCGRTNYNMEPIVNEMEKFLNTLNANIKVAIMGCVVNGPGEAKDADIGIAGGINEALLFKKGQIIKKIPQDDIVDTLKKEIINLIKEAQD